MGSTYTEAPQIVTQAQDQGPGAFRRQCYLLYLYTTAFTIILS